MTLPFYGGGLPWQPSDNGLAVAVDDPYACQSTSGLTAGTIYVAKMKVPAAVPVNNVVFMSNGSAGAGASTGSFAALLSSAGTRLAVSADLASVLTGSFVPLVCPLLSTALLSPPFVWAVILSNLATTQPTLATGQGNGNFTNLNLAAALLRFATAGTAQTSIPASISPGSLSTAGNLSIWAGAY